MGRLDQLLTAYRRHVSIPIRSQLPISQRIWFLVYPPEDERRVMGRVTEFELATQEAGLDWHRIDLLGIFADWMDTFPADERDECLANPDIVEAYADSQFEAYVRDRLTAAVDAVKPEARDRTVFAVTGLMELFDFVHVSAVVSGLDNRFPGVLLIFFPGEREGTNYSFLGARTGWNYLAVPILAEG